MKAGLPIHTSSVITDHRGRESGEQESDTANIRLLYSLAKENINTNPVIAENYAEKALQLSRTIKSREFIALGCFLLGSVKLGLGEYVEAEKYLSEGLSNFSRNNKKQEIAATFNSLGILHDELGNFEKALEYYRKSIEIFGKLDRKDVVSIIELNVGEIYSELGRTEEADELFTRLIGFFQTGKDTMNLIPAYIRKGELFLSKNKLDSAAYYARKGLSLSEDYCNIKELIDSYFLLGKVLLSANQINESNDYVFKALELADSLNSRRDIAVIAKSMSENFLTMGDSVKAYAFLTRNNYYEGEFRKEETLKNIAKRELDEQYRISRNRTQMFYLSMISLLISIMLIIAVYRNFRIKQKANRLLVQMDELKSRFFSDLTHEFRTPLTLILAPLEEMLSAGAKKNPSRSELKMMQRNAGHLLNLVNQMLDLAKLDAKNLKLDLTENDFINFFKVRVLSFSSLASSKGIKFSYSVPGKPLNTLFDADKLEKIINNLLSNAIKFTGAGGEVKCVLEIVDKAKEMIRFFVEDTGTGISNDELGKIFERYYQVEGSMRSGTFGTGIGLSLTRELVRLMHGEIHVESEPGCGSRFTVTLQLGKTHLGIDEYTILKRIMPPSAGEGMKPEGAEKLPGKSEATPERKAGRNDLPVVLIVEDQEDIRNYLAGHIGDNFRVLEAENGVLGLRAAIQYVPDLVITDLIMPGMDGLEMCAKLKEDERSSHIPVIMLTAKTDLPDRLAGIGTGADAYLTKPFHIQEVLLVISKMIEQRKKLRERFSTNIKLEPGDIAITSADEKFLSRALAVIEDHLGDSGFDVSIFQKEMAMSRMQLFRKIKAMTDQAPGDFIRIIRLKRAARLIEEGFGNIAQITYEVGFNNPSHFAKSFKELFGILPSDYAKKVNQVKSI